MDEATFMALAPEAQHQLTADTMIWLAQTRCPPQWRIAAQGLSELPPLTKFHLSQGPSEAADQYIQNILGRANASPDERLQDELNKATGPMPAPTTEPASFAPSNPFDTTPRTEAALIDAM